MSKVLFVLLGIVTLSYAGEMRISTSQITPSKANLDISLSPAPTTNFEFAAVDTKDVQALTVQSKSAPMNLIILVDASSLCSYKKVDNYINALLANLRFKANAQSRITLVSYTGEAIKFLAKRVATSALEGVQFECQGRSMSISYDQPLAKALDDEKKSELPTVAWVFTSGNIDLSQHTVKRIQDRNVELHLMLYNEFVEKEIKPVFIASVAQLSQQFIRFSSLAKLDEVTEFPSQKYQVSVTFPPSLQGSKALVDVQARSGQTVFAKTPITFSIPLNDWVYFWRKYRIPTIALLLLAFVGYLAYVIYSYYKPRYCTECKRKLSFRYPVCLFCRKEGDAFLVGNFLMKADGFRKKISNQYEVLPLVNEDTEIGSHRKSPIRVLKKKRASRFAIIRKEKLATGEYGFQIIRAPDAQDIVIEVNEHTVEKNRFLASGDSILIGTARMNFLSGVNKYE